MGLSVYETGGLMPSVFISEMQWTWEIPKELIQWTELDYLNSISHHYGV